MVLGWVFGSNGNKANTAPIELELGLSLAISLSLSHCRFRWGLDAHLPYRNHVAILFVQLGLGLS